MTCLAIIWMFGSQRVLERIYTAVIIKPLGTYSVNLTEYSLSLHKSDVILFQNDLITNKEANYIVPS